VALDVIVEIVPLLAGRKRDKLQASARKRPRNVAAEFENWIAVALDQIVVVNRKSRGANPVILEQVEAARLPAAVEMDRLVWASVEAPGCGNERVLIEVTVVLAPVFNELTGFNVGEVVGAFFELAIAPGSRGQVEGRRASAIHHRPLNVGVDVPGEPALRRSGHVGIEAGFLRQDDVQDLALAGI